MDPALKKLAFFFIDLVLPFGIGYMMVSRGGVRRFFDRALKVNFVTLVPVLTALSIWALEFRREYAWLPIFGLAMQLIPAYLSRQWARLRHDDPIKRGGFVLAAGLSNRGTVGILTAYLLFGEQGFACSRLVIILSPILIYGFGFPWAQRLRTKRLGVEVKRPRLTDTIFSPNMIPAVGVLIGWLLRVSPWSRPEFIEPVVPWLLHVMIWLFILPLGASMDFGEMRRYWRDVLALGVVKFILTPAVILLLAHLVGMSGVGRDVVVVLAFSPTAIFAVVMSRLFDLDIHMAMAAFVGTTTLYLVIVLPVLMLIFG